MQKKYDVVIVGAGLAGLSVAQELQNRNVSFIVVEGSKKFGHRHHIGIFNSQVKKFNLESCVVNRLRRFTFLTPAKSFVHLFGRKEGISYVDLNKLSSIIDKRIKGKIRFNTWIKDICYVGGELCLVDENKNNIFAKMVIDCSGKGSSISSKMGVEGSDIYCKTLSYTLDNCSAKDKSNSITFLDSSLTSSGGAWIVPLKGTKFHVGISNMFPYNKPGREELEKKLNLFLIKKEIHGVDFRRSRRITKKIFKDSPAIRPAKRFVKDNLILLGDSAGQPSSFFGMGSPAILDMARVAAGIVEEAVKKDDFSRSQLSSYETYWKKNFGRYEFFNGVLREIVMRLFDDEAWDLMIDKLNSLSGKEFFEVLKSNYTLGILFKLSSFRLAIKLFSNFIEVVYDRRV